MEEKQNVSAAFYLGVTNECNANRQFPLHATREGFRASMSFVLEVQDADDPVHLIWDLIFGVAFQLCIEEQVLSDCKVIKQYVMLGTEAQTAADQSHVLTDVVPVDISSATGRGKQTWSTSAGELISSSDIFECVNVSLLAFTFVVAAHLSAWTVLWFSRHHCVQGAP